MVSSRPASPERLPPTQSRDETPDSSTDNKSAVIDTQRATSDAEKVDPSKEVQWVTGLKLWILMTPLCFTFFLVLLDISIIATVSPFNMINLTISNTDPILRLSHKSPMNSTHSQTWAGTAQHINSQVRQCNP